jgi:hypothetical protein
VFSTLLTDTVAVTAILGFLGASASAAVKLRAALKANARAVADTAAERKQLAADLIEMTKDRDYERSRADGLQSLINNIRLGGS